MSQVEHPPPRSQESIQAVNSSGQMPGSAESNGSCGSFKLKVEPLHHPKEMAHVEVPHNVENVPRGKTLLTGKALLAKKMSSTGASFYSPSDALVSPCTQKLSSQKNKRWASAKVKPAVFGKSNLNTSSGLFDSQKGAAASSELEPEETPSINTAGDQNDENVSPDPQEQGVVALENVNDTHESRE